MCSYVRASPSPSVSQQKREFCDEHHTPKLSTYSVTETERPIRAIFVPIARENAPGHREEVFLPVGNIALECRCTYGNELLLQKIPSYIFEEPAIKTLSLGFLRVQWQARAAVRVSIPRSIQRLNGRRATRGKAIWRRHRQATPICVFRDRLPSTQWSCLFLFRLAPFIAGQRPRDTGNATLESLPRHTGDIRRGLTKQFLNLTSCH